MFFYNLQFERKADGLFWRNKGCCCHPLITLWDYSSTSYLYYIWFLAESVPPTIVFLSFSCIKSLANFTRLSSLNLKTNPVNPFFFFSKMFLRLFFLCRVKEEWLFKLLSLGSKDFNYLWPFQIHFCKCIMQTCFANCKIFPNVSNFILKVNLLRKLWNTEML